MKRTTAVAQAIRRRHPLDVFRFVAELPNFVKLFAGLLRDQRVSAWPKLLLLAAAVYVVSPVDFLPDVMPVLSQLDDLALFGLAARFFLSMCEPEVVSDHIARVDPRGRWRPFQAPIA